MNYSKLLKNIRDKKLLTQEELAKELGVSFATVNRIEGNLHMPSFATRRKIHKYCELNGITLK